MTEEAVAAAYKPISASRSDTEETIRQIQEHNNVYWCANEDLRPGGFDASLCD